METDPLIPAMAIEFIKKCKIEGKKILGVERIFLIEGNFIPDLEGIIDFTMEPALQRNPASDADSASEFIRQATTENSYFTVVYK
jgi:hypothetical protein